MAKSLVADDDDDDEGGITLVSVLPLACVELVPPD